MAQHETAKPLAPRQQRFVEEYLRDLNGTAAYQRAGYAATPRVARSNAVRLLANASVQAAIAEAQASRAQRVHLTQDAVLHELKLLATSDIRHYLVDDRGDITLGDGAPPDAMRAVSSLKKKITHTETSVTYETTITLWSKPAAIKMAGEHLGVFKGAEPTMPDIHVHVHTVRERLATRLGHLATRHAQDGRNGH
jgi:phage terminase small subunit